MHLVIEEDHKLFSVEAQSTITVERDFNASLAMSICIMGNRARSDVRSQICR